MPRNAPPRPSTARTVAQARARQQPDHAWTRKGDRVALRSEDEELAPPPRWTRTTGGLGALILVTWGYAIVSAGGLVVEPGSELVAWWNHALVWLSRNTVMPLIAGLLVLHWAAGLARYSILRSLRERG